MGVWPGGGAKLPHNRSRRRQTLPMRSLDLPFFFLMVDGPKGYHSPPLSALDSTRAGWCGAERGGKNPDFGPFLGGENGSQFVIFSKKICVSIHLPGASAYQKTAFWVAIHWFSAALMGFWHKKAFFCLHFVTWRPFFSNVGFVFQHKWFKYFRDL